ncbi:MAG: hypothetical protein F6K48_11400 [Okeania sp. SIO3H1]|nr:hypothetical protein [Okeania sp. SIO3H1]
MSLKVTYWSPDLRIEVFEWERNKFLYLPSTLIFFSMIFISGFIQYPIIRVCVWKVFLLFVGESYTGDNPPAGPSQPTPSQEGRGRQEK